MGQFWKWLGPKGGAITAPPFSAAYPHRPVSVAFSFFSILFSSFFSLFLFPRLPHLRLRVDRCEIGNGGKKKEVEQFFESYPLHPLFEEADGKERFVYRHFFHSLVLFSSSSSLFLLSSFCTSELCRRAVWGCHTVLPSCARSDLVVLSIVRVAKGKKKKCCSEFSVIEGKKETRKGKVMRVQKSFNLLFCQVFRLPRGAAKEYHRFFLLWKGERRKETSWKKTKRKVKKNKQKKKEAETTG